MFSMIDAKEYICDLWKHPDPLTKENLSRFENVIVMMWCTIGVM